MDGTTNTGYAYEDVNRVSYPGKAPDKNNYIFDWWVTSSSEQRFDFLNDETYPKMVLAGKYHKYEYAGNENVWVSGNTGDLYFRFVRYEHVLRDKLYEGSLNALFTENDKQLLIDDVLLDYDQFASSDGSLIISVHDPYLNKLPAGTHRLTVRFADGEASTDFYVRERVRPVTPSHVLPKTGDQ